MDGKYPHWYHDGAQMGHGEECCMEPDLMYGELPPHKVRAFPDSAFKDRLLCLLGDEVLFSVDARIRHQESFCGTLCYVGCDFIIVNTCICRKSISMHVPICMLRFIAPFKGRRG
jgi:hypothetical protein